MAIASSNAEGDEVDTLQFSFASDIVELVVLTRDELFLQTLRAAVGGPKRVWHVLSAEKVSDLLVAGEVGIVVLDVAAMHEAPQQFVAQIKRQFPSLVVVVAGSREAEIALAGLISTGVVYRFIHKPMSPGRARLFAEAAVRKYAEQRLEAEVPRRYAPPRNHRRLGAISVLALIVIGTMTWALRSAWRPEPRVATALPAAAAHGVQGPAAANGRAQLAEARDRLLARAENALLEERTEEAAAAIEAARQAGVENGRIAFLNTQLAELKVRIKSAQAARLRASAAKSSRAPPGDERLTSLLNLASQRLDNGQLLEPDHDSARYYIEAASSIDSSDAGVQEARRDLGTRLVAKARLALTLQQYPAARSLVDEAKSIGFSSPDEDSVQQELDAQAAKD